MLGALQQRRERDRARQAPAMVTGDTCRKGPAAIAAIELLQPLEHLDHPYPAVDEIPPWIGLLTARACLGAAASPPRPRPGSGPLRAAAPGRPAPVSAAAASARPSRPQLARQRHHGTAARPSRARAAPPRGRSRRRGCAPPGCRAGSRRQLRDAAGGARSRAASAACSSRWTTDASARAERRPCQPGIGIDPGLAQPVERQVEPAGPGVLADVARDVGELHRDAEIAGPRQRVGRRARPSAAPSWRRPCRRRARRRPAARPDRHSGGRRHPTRSPRAGPRAARAGSRTRRPRRPAPDRPARPAAGPRRPASSRSRSRPSAAGRRPRGRSRRRPAGRTRRARWRARAPRGGSSSDAAWNVREPARSASPAGGEVGGGRRCSGSDQRAASGTTESRTRGGRQHAGQPGPGMRAGTDEIEAVDLFAAVVRAEPGALRQHRLQPEARRRGTTAADPGNPAASACAR